MTGDLIAGLDVGTTSIKLYVYNSETWKVVYRETVQSPRIVSKNGETRHDAEKLYEIVRLLYNKAREKGARCIGLSTYRGSLVVWRSKDGKPVTNVVTWMDTSSYKYYEEKLPFIARILSKIPRLGSALQPESFIVRLAALLEENKKLYEYLESGEYLVWNIDAYLLYRMFGDYISDPTISALTGMYNPKNMHELRFLAKSLGLPRIRLPKLVLHDNLINDTIGIVMGDQQAALHGLECGEDCIKISLGTGFFIDNVTGDRLYMGSSKGLIPLIVYWSKAKRMYGVESYIPGLGESVKMLVDGLLNSNYSLLDSANKEPAKVFLYAWGVRYPRLPPGSLVLKFERNRVSLDSLASGIVKSVTEAVGFHLELLLSVVYKPERVILTGGLVRSKNIQNSLKHLLEERFNIKEVHVFANDASALGVAKLSYKNCFQ